MPRTDPSRCPDCRARRFLVALEPGAPVEYVCPNCVDPDTWARILARCEAPTPFYDQDATPSRARGECVCGAPMVQFAGLTGCVVCDSLDLWPRVRTELTETEQAVIAECASFSRGIRYRLG